eukprot:1772455-Amphidinium_carterae.1
MKEQKNQENVHFVNVLSLSGPGALELCRGGGKIFGPNHKVDKSAHALTKGGEGSRALSPFSVR